MPAVAVAPAVKSQLMLDGAKSEKSEPLATNGEAVPMAKGVASGV